MQYTSPIAHTKVSFADLTLLHTPTPSLLCHAVDSKQPPKDQHYTMDENIAYGMVTAPCSSTVNSNDRQYTVDDGYSRKGGYYHVVDGSVYEVPSVHM